MDRIDLNCDMGESWHDEIIGQDADIMPLISSCNLACGVHGGDPETMVSTLRLAIRHGVRIGAHPSLPGRENFGREAVDLPPTELYDLVLTQAERLRSAAGRLGASVVHLKPHGALYHLAARQEMVANIIADICRKTGITYLFGPPGSQLAAAARAKGLHFVPEGFIDRVYEDGDRLRPRQLPGSVIHDSDRATTQAIRFVQRGQVEDYYGKVHQRTVKTLCIHGDHPEALDHLMAVRERFGAAGIRISP